MHELPHLRSAALLVSLLLACGGGGESSPDARPPLPDAGVTYVSPNFTPPTPNAGADWGTIPYPSDLFLDADGLMTLTSLPTGPNPDPTAITMLTEALHVMDGAGINSHAYFPMSGDVDVASLAGNVKLVDLDNSLAEIPVDLLYRPEIGAIMAAPLRGFLLEENHRYAAYVTTDVTDSSGAQIVPSANFTAAADLSQTPADPAIAAAQESLRPLLEALDASVRDKLAVATVFRTQNTSEDLIDMFAVAKDVAPVVSGPYDVYAGTTDLDFIFGGAQDPTAPVGADDTDKRAQPHSNVAIVMHASIEVPSFRNVDPLAAGFMERDSGGTPIIKGTNTVRFTLTLPAGATSYANMPVLLWVHGINQSRADMLLFTDEVNKRGYAYVGMDMLYHGDRRTSPRDVQRNVIEADCEGGADPCDGIGDRAGLIPATQLFHLAPSGGVPAYHPRAIMENLRQSAIDLVAMNNFLASGDLTEINAQLLAAGLPNDLSFRGDDIGILTESLGAMPALLVAAVDARVKVGFIASPANSFPYPLLFHSAAFADTFGAVVTRPWDVADRTLIADPIKGARNEPIIMLWNSVIERGDAAAFGRYVSNGDLRGDSGINMLLTQTWQDEWVSNSAVEHLIGVMGLPMMKITRAIEPPDSLFRYVPALAEEDGPIMGNKSSGTRTQVATLWYPAAHALLRKLEDYYENSPDLVPVPIGQQPFAPLDEIWYFCNPIANIHSFWGDFFEQHYNGQTPSVSDPFPTAVPPGMPPCD